MVLFLLLGGPDPGSRLTSTITVAIVTLIYRIITAMNSKLIAIISSTRSVRGTLPTLGKTSYWQQAY